MLKRKLPQEMSLNITSMMDLFTIILVFLLKSFGSSSVNIQVSEHLKLAKSSSSKPPVEIISLIVDRKNILIDGKVILAHTDGSINSAFMDDTNFLIKPLFDSLLSKAKRAKFISEQNKNFDFEGKIILQMHKTLPFDLLRKIMYTAGQAEYNEFKFIAIKKE